LKRRYRIFPPSSGHQLVRLVTDRTGRLKHFIQADEVIRAAVNIVGPIIEAWAVPQLLAISEVVHLPRAPLGVEGWPANA
jgi:hypothetical protein